jgi:hypothetical protein
MISLVQVFMFFPSNNNLLYFPIGKQDRAFHCFFLSNMIFIRFIEKTNLAVKDWITSVYKIKRIKYKIQ